MDIEKGGKLSDKRKRFVQEYLVDFNGAQAAIRAGYREGSAKVTASRLLTDANVQRYLESLLVQKRSQLSHSSDVLIHELECIAHSNLKDYGDPNAVGPFQFRPLSSLSRDEMAPIDRISHTGDEITQIVFKDKMKALELLLKIRGGIDPQPAPPHGKSFEELMEEARAFCRDLERNNEENEARRGR